MPVRHALIRRKAQLLDRFVDYYKAARGRSNFPHKVVGQIVPTLFPRSRSIGRGAFKSVWQVSSRAKDLALKTAHYKNITKEKRAYNSLPRAIRNRYFAKIYWRTKYCSLQKYGRRAKVPPAKLKKLKSIGRQYGLGDIRPENIRKIDGRFKIVDAEFRRPE